MPQGYYEEHCDEKGKGACECNREDPMITALEILSLAVAILYALYRIGFRIEIEVPRVQVEIKKADID